MVADAYQGGNTNPDCNCHVIPPNSVLSIDLELLSFKPVISVTNDSKVMKKILKEGQGALTADEGAVVTGKNNGKVIEIIETACG